MKRHPFLFTILIFIVLVSCSSYFSIKLHDKKGIRNWRSEIFADASGYNVYLPALLLYHWDGRRFPVDIENQVGAAFNIDKSTGLIRIKVTCGVAYLQSPFFVMGNLLTIINKEKLNGYSYYNFRAIDVSGCFFMWLGLFFVFFMLRKRFSGIIALITTGFIGFGSNIFYYGFIQPGYSHIYSFVVFAALLWLFDRVVDSQKYSLKNMFLVGLLYALAILIRPTNVFIGLIFIFWNTFGWDEIKGRLKMLIRWQNLAVVSLAFALVMAPQILYWYFAFGKPIYYSYPGEGFTNWQHPQFLSLWFEPCNGLFTYSPLLFIIIIGMVVSFINKQKSSLLPILLFVIMSYVFASWFVVAYGGSFGCRPFAEYFVFFALPLASLFQLTHHKLLKGLILFCVIVCMIFTLKMTLIYNDNMFLTQTVWNWDEYTSLIKRGVRTTSQEFEDGWVNSDDIIKTTDPHHGKHIFYITKQAEYSPLLLDENYMKGTFSPYRYADISIDVKSNSPTRTLIAHTIDSCGKIVDFEYLDIDYDSPMLHQWHTFNFYDIWIGGNYSKDFSMKYYIWNRYKCSFYIDNLSLYLH